MSYILNWSNVLNIALREKDLLLQRRMYVKKFSCTISCLMLCPPTYFHMTGVSVLVCL